MSYCRFAEVPQVDLPPCGRRQYWTVVVEGESADPATLFEPVRDLLALCPERHAAGAVAHGERLPSGRHRQGPGAGVDGIFGQVDPGGKVPDVQPARFEGGGGIAAADRERVFVEELQPGDPEGAGELIAEVHAVVE